MTIKSWTPAWAYMGGVTNINIVRDKKGGVTKLVSIFEKRFSKYDGPIIGMHNLTWENK